MKKTLLFCLTLFITTIGFSQEEDRYALVEKYSSDDLEYNKYTYTSDWLVESRDILLMNGTRLKDSLRYNELNYISKLDTYQFIGNEWKHTSYIEYTYDANGNKTSRSNYNSFGGSTFTLGGIYNYVYEDNKQTSWELFFGGNDLFEIGTLTYNSDGKLAQKIGQSIWGGVPENSWKLEYDYNSDGTLATSKQYFWNGQSWEYNSGEWFDYDEDKNCIKWDRKSGNTVIDRFEYSYDMDISQDNVILPQNPEDDLIGEDLVEMQHMLIKKAWHTQDANTGELVYICDYFYDYLTIPVLGVPSHEMAVDAITIFPSPAQDEVTVLSKNVLVNGIKIMDVNGKQVMNVSNMNMRESKLDVSGLQSGMYIIHISTNNGAVSQRLIVQ